MRASGWCLNIFGANGGPTRGTGRGKVKVSDHMKSNQRQISMPFSLQDAVSKARDAPGVQVKRTAHAFLPVFVANQRLAELRKIKAFCRGLRGNAGPSDVSRVEVERGCVRLGQPACGKGGHRDRQDVGRTAEISKHRVGMEFQQKRVKRTKTPDFRDESIEMRNRLVAAPTTRRVWEESAVLDGTRQKKLL